MSVFIVLLFFVSSTSSNASRGIHIRAYVHPGEQFECARLDPCASQKKSRITLRVSASGNITDPGCTDQVPVSISVGKQIGGGTWGTIYAGMDASTGRSVAVKMDQKRREFWEMEDAWGGRYQDLRHECDLLNELHDDYGLWPVPKCHAHCVIQGRDVLVMDFIHNVTPATEHTWTQIDPDAVSHAVEKIIWHIVTMLQANIVNVDQRPVNVLLGRNGTVHFIDMGMAMRRRDVHEQCASGSENGLLKSKVCGDVAPHEHWRDIAQRFVEVALGVLPRSHAVLIALPAAITNVGLPEDVLHREIFRRAVLQFSKHGEQTLQEGLRRAFYQ